MEYRAWIVCNNLTDTVTPVLNPSQCVMVDEEMCAKMYGMQVEDTLVHDTLIIMCREKQQVLKVQEQLQQIIGGK